ncbi:DUF1702 family protein [Micromonospora chersina]|uniref:DUF1702 family protein n=1 Tax=Micromonospora chersina TaxID=47854 RepID=UPI0033FD405E
MPSTLGSLRRRVLTPSMAQVGFAARGFPGADSPARPHLEAIPQAVICGFEWGIEGCGLGEVEQRVDLVSPELRGFAYEGVTMAFTVLDAMAAGRGRRARALLSGPAVPHTFLTYIGIGFAMTRLPRPLWKNVLPDLSGTPYYPTMSWLAVDGYGFDLAYFHTRRWVDEQRRPRPYPWLGRSDYFLRAVDQGIGRALWFIHGARVQGVADAVNGFAESRQADLWSGVGLAATFAGGATGEDLAALCRHAGPYQPDLAQGAVFAAKARSFSGHEPAYTAAAVSALAGLSISQAAALADDVAVQEQAAGSAPAYELWRERVRLGVGAARAS